MKVQIDRDREGWRYRVSETLSSVPFPTYPAAHAAAIADGHEIDNAGWRHKMILWNWHGHAIDGFPGWEVADSTRSPAFAKLTHVRGDGLVESRELAEAWDDEAKVGFYQRDWTESSLPIVHPGEIYWSGWWFATFAERDRFAAWIAARCPATGIEIKGAPRGA